MFISGRLGSEESPTDIPGCADKEGGMQPDANQSSAQIQLVKLHVELSNIVPSYSHLLDCLYHIQKL